MSRYVLGVDGGGTKTHCALFDTNGNKIDFVSWGTTNHERLKYGFDDLKKELHEMIFYILRKNCIGLNQLVKCVFGLSGVDTKSQHDKISGILKDIGIKDFILCNDAYLGIKAGCCNGYGICAINGTGFSVVGIDPYEKMFQIGGLFELTGDFGGGVLLSKSAISSVYNALFKGEKNTRMTDFLFEMLHVTSKYDLMDVIIEKISNQSIKIQDFSKVVFLAANEGDEIALQILDDMGKEYAISINAVFKELNFDGCANVDIVLAGSLFVKGENPAAIIRLKDDVISENRNKKISFKILEHPPVAGAVTWALEAVNGSSLYYDKVIREIDSSVK